MGKQKEHKDATPFVRDLYAMAVELTKREVKPGQIVYTLLHDLQGIINNDVAFLPKCTGYWKIYGYNNEETKEG